MQQELQQLIAQNNEIKEQVSVCVCVFVCMCVCVCLWGTWTIH